MESPPEPGEQTNKDVHLGGPTTLVVHLAISAIDSQTIPLLIFVDDKDDATIAISAVIFIRYLQKQGRYSYGSLTKFVVVIGKLYEFFLVTSHGVLSRPPINFLDDFLYCLDYGVLPGWRPLKGAEFAAARGAVLKFVKFLHDSQLIDMNEREYAFLEKVTRSFNSAAHAEKSLLMHTRKRSRKKEGDGRRRGRIGLIQFKPFPEHLVTPLIEETGNIRDKLLFALLAYGGRRISELLHLFIMDVTVRGRDLQVVLRHPNDSPMSWSSVSGALLKGSREHYLRSSFGRLPRNEHGSLPSAVGWKGIKFDDLKTLSSETYFIREVDELLISLHNAYLATRSRAVNHPYYFVTESGTPLNISAVEKQFSAACKRLEKSHGVSLSGYGVHSLRHYYGFYCAEVLEAPLLLIQKWMGHVQPSSTAVYVHLSPRVAARKLKEFERASRLGVPGVSDELIRPWDTSYGRRETMGEADDATRYGNFDPAKQTRNFKR